MYVFMIYRISITISSIATKPRAEDLIHAAVAILNTAQTNYPT
jgi:hypothetical protein